MSDNKPDIVYKRRFRWTFELDTPYGRVSELFAIKADRPKLKLDPPVFGFAQVLLEPIRVTYIDTASEDQKSLWAWIATKYDFESGNPPEQDSESYGTATLTLFDGAGEEIERWMFEDVQLLGADFGDLDYSSTETATITLTLGYTRVRYEGVSGPNPHSKNVGQTVPKEENG
jgi:hypothetical protein